MKTITLLTCDNIQEAYILKGRLENEGIYCFIKNENYSNLKPNFNNVYGYGPQLVINEKDLEKSRKILYDNVEGGKQINICPRCGSANIGLGRSRNIIARFFIVLIAILFVIPLRKKPPKIYCRECKTIIS